MYFPFSYFLLLCLIFAFTALTIKLLRTSRDLKDLHCQVGRLHKMLISLSQEIRKNTHSESKDTHSESKEFDKPLESHFCAPKEVTPNDTFGKAIASVAPSQTVEHKTVARQFKVANPQSECVEVEDKILVKMSSKIYIWLGAIALILSGFFLVKYSLENFSFSPIYRVISAIIMGSVLVCIAEFTYRKKISIHFNWTLSGAGVAVIFLAISGAYGYYDLISKNAAFCGVVFTAFCGILLSLRYGQPVAVLSLLGFFISPLLVSSKETNVFLFFYLFTVSFFSLAILVKNRYFISVYFLIFSNILWSIAWAVSVSDTSKMPYFAAYLFATSILFYSVFIKFFKENKDLRYDISASVFTIFSAMIFYAKSLHYSANFDFNYLWVSYFPVFAFMVCFMSLRSHVLRYALCLLPICLPYYFNLQPELKSETFFFYLNLISFGGFYFALFIKGNCAKYASSMLVFMFFTFALLTISSDFLWSLAGLVTGAEVNAEGFHEAFAKLPSGYGSLLATSLIALIPIAASYCIVKVRPSTCATLQDKFYVTNILRLGIVIFTMFLILGTKPLFVNSLYLLAPILLCVFLEFKKSKFADYQIFSDISFTLSLIVLIYLFGIFWNFSFCNYLYPECMWIFLIPVVSLLISFCSLVVVSVRRGEIHNDKAVLFIAGQFIVALTVIGVLLSLGLKAMHEYLFDSLVMVLIGVAILILAICAKKFASENLTKFSKFCVALYLIRFILVDLIFFASQTYHLCGTHILNVYCVSLFCPMLIFAAYSYIFEKGKMKLGCAVFVLLLGFLFVNFQVRFTFLLCADSITDGNFLEPFCYSIAWLLYGILLLIIGIFAKSTMLMRASSVFVMLSVLKVFVYDASELAGLYRVLSFGILGVCLMGIGYFYSRYVFKPRQNS